MPKTDIIDKDKSFKSGYVSIAGRTNVGKSTLINRILGVKIAITSRKPNTTRNRILGIKNMQGAQMVLLDTPGIHASEKSLNRFMVTEALKACGEADIIILMIDALKPWQEEDIYSIEKISNIKVPALLVINKIDLVEKNSLLPIIDEAANKADFKEIFPVSALTGDGVEELVKTVTSYLPEGPPYFPEDMLTDRAERFIAAETVREKVFKSTANEVPYSTAVTVEEFKEEKDLIKISAVIHVERESQKAIIIGKKGAMLKKIGTAARKELEKFLGQKIYLKLFVRVEKNWTRDPRAIRKLGYRDSH